MKTFFTADLHFGCDHLREHTRAEYRTIEDHDEAILQNLNEVVMRRDRLVILGDFCLEKPGRYRPRIKCAHIFFILGNHDKPQKTRNVFGGNVWEGRTVKCDRGNVFCSHYPHAYWDDSHYGVCHAYGHLHYNQDHEDRMDLAFPERRSMDVGIDNAKRILGEHRAFTEDEFFDRTLCFKGHGLVERR